MTYDCETAGRVEDEASNPGRDLLWTPDAVKDRLVDALWLWRRSPGGGKWPFASDAPWHLITRATRIECGGFKGRELQLRKQDEDAEEAKRWAGLDRRGALTRDEVSRRDEATEWLTLVDEDARKVLIAGIVQLAAGRSNIDWRRVKASIGVEIGNKGVYRRYTRAIAAIANGVNAGRPNPAA